MNLYFFTQKSALFSRNGFGSFVWRKHTNPCGSTSCAGCNADSDCEGTGHGPYWSTSYWCQCTRKGTSNGVITDIDGNFSLKVSSPNAVVVISYIGYKTVELPASNTKNWLRLP